MTQAIAFVNSKSDVSADEIGSFGRRAVDGLREGELFKSKKIRKG